MSNDEPTFTFWRLNNHYTTVEYTLTEIQEMMTGHIVDTELFGDDRLPDATLAERFVDQVNSWCDRGLSHATASPTKWSASQHRGSGTRKPTYNCRLTCEQNTVKSGGPMKIICVVCDTPFEWERTGPGGTRKTCSPECQRKRKNLKSNECRERVRDCPPHMHGTISGYTYFTCDCDKCRNAMREYKQQWRKGELPPRVREPGAATPSWSLRIEEPWDIPALSGPEEPCQHLTVYGPGPREGQCTKCHDTPAVAGE